MPHLDQFPAALASNVEKARLGPMRVPSLLIHPTWERPAPFVLWMHGRTVNKELDPGRYLRWMRAGIATVSVDLPGHGERMDAAYQAPKRSLDVLAQMRAEIDGVIHAISTSEYAKVFDMSRIGIGGMSLGGMVTLRRLCDPHPFKAAAVECTTGFLRGLYIPGEYANAPRWNVEHDPEQVRKLDPSLHLETWKPIPLLALHTDADEIVPEGTQRRFVSELKGHYAKLGVDSDMIEYRTWPETGAPQEHAGFGRFSNDAKNAQTEFFVKHLRPE